MQITYLLLVHKSPIQMKRLIEALRYEDACFCIHVDKKSDIKKFNDVVPQGDGVYYVDDDKRVDGRWGDLSMVEAAFETMRLALSLNREGHFVLLSGQDYPIRSNKYIKEFLSRHERNNFISIFDVPDPKKTTENGGYERFITWTYDCKNPKDGRMKAKIQPLSFRLKTIGGFVRLALYRPSLLPEGIRHWFKRRHYPDGLAMVFNEFWCTLTKEAVEKILHIYSERDDIREYYKYTHIPEETLFGSVLCNDKDLKGSILPMCHYIDWDISMNGSPKTLEEEDMKKIEAAMEENPHILFARKFEEGSGILDVIDSYRAN